MKDETPESSYPTPIKAIRLHCLECLGNSSQEVERCSRSKCPLWRYRLGKNPNITLSADVKERRAKQALKNLVRKPSKPKPL